MKTKFELTTKKHAERLSMKIHNFLVLTYCFIILNLFLDFAAWANTVVTVPATMSSGLSGESDYFRKIQPILERRCVVCHSCFEAPCQLKLNSPSMLLRGATKHLTTGGFTTESRTDLMFDIEAQRAGGFFSVLEMDDNADSILELVLKAGRDQKQNLPPEKYIAPEKYQCVASTEKFKDLNADDQKRIGMPYYTSPLSEEDYETLITWLQKGAQLPDQSEIDARMLPKNPKAIQKWEDFLNAPTWKARWTSRYLYEHLFTAHFYFEESPGEFYELVRSETAAPQAIIEIASKRPFSIPAVFADRFYYRIRKVQQTIVHKQHFIYPINKEGDSLFLVLCKCVCEKKFIRISG
jgi:hypothetical protein